MRTSKGYRGLLCAAVLGSIAGVAAPAAADDLAINRFYPAPAGDRLFGAQSAFVNGDLTPHAALIVDYAHNPLVLRRRSTDEALGAVVSNQLYLHLNGSMALFERLLLNVDVPVALFQNGENPTNTLGITSPSGADFGDLRLGLRLRVLGDYDSLFQLAIGGYVWLPTGTGAFVTDATARGLPQVILGGMHDRFVYSVAIGPEIRKDQNYFDNVLLGTTFVSNGGIGFLFGEERNFQIGPEFNVTASMRETTRQSLNAEALLGAKYRFAESLEAGVAVGAGLASGIGTPDVRVIGSIAYTPRWKPKDTDQDGIVDKEDACVDVKGVKHPDSKKNGCPSDRDDDTILDVQDACPDVKGVASADAKKNGCPPDSDDDGIYDDKDACPDVKGVADADPAKNGCPPDRDKDGILDAQDACVDVPGVADPDAKKNGCPPDKDNDGVYDAQDACPDIAGVKTSDPATNGCPGDTDGDKIRDDKDACPNEKGAADPDPKQNGCPKAVRVTDTEVIILQQVQFDTSKATIRKVSDALLDEVAAVLNEHPELLKIEIQGHTDSRGSKQLNTKLSQARADAVKAAMVKRGVSADRLQTMGFGPDRPVGDNANEEGRQQNRRVQFVILEKKMKDGSIKKFEPAAKQLTTAADGAKTEGATAAGAKKVAPKAPAPAAPKAPAPAAPKAPTPAAPKAPAPAAPKAPAPKK